MKNIFYIAFLVCRAW